MVLVFQKHHKLLSLSSDPNSSQTAAVTTIVVGLGAGGYIYVSPSSVAPVKLRRPGALRHTLWCMDLPHRRWNIIKGIRNTRTSASSRTAVLRGFRSVAVGRSRRLVLYTLVSERPAGRTTLHMIRKACGGYSTPIHIFQRRWDMSRMSSNRSQIVMREPLLSIFGLAFGEMVVCWLWEEV